MRKAIILLALVSIPLAAFAYVSPGKPTGFVNDFAGVIPATQRDSLEARLASLEKATGDEVAVATVPSLGGETVETYAEKLFQEWGIGNAGHDNGILILVSTGDHEARIEVGYGLEGTLTDLQSGNIIRNVMVPAFKGGDYAGGISGAVDAIADIIEGSPDAAQYSETGDSPERWGFSFQALFAIAIIVLNVLSRILGSTRSWWLGGVLGAIAGIIIGIIWGLFIGIISSIILGLLGLLFDFIVSKRPPGSGGGGLWPIFFGGRGSGPSGGFGGFGGGSSGGGGASGKW